MTDDSIEFKRDTVDQFRDDIEARLRGFWYTQLDGDDLFVVPSRELWECVSHAAVQFAIQVIRDQKEES